MKMLGRRRKLDGGERRPAGGELASGARGRERTEDAGEPGAGKSQEEEGTGEKRIRKKKKKKVIRERKKRKLGTEKKGKTPFCEVEGQFCETTKTEEGGCKNAGGRNRKLPGDF